MLGSDSRWRNPCTGPIGVSLIVAPVRSSVIVWPPATVTCCPFAAASTWSSVAAIPSTAPAATAALAG